MDKKCTKCKNCHEYDMGKTDTSFRYNEILYRISILTKRLKSEMDNEKTSERWVLLHWINDILDANIFLNPLKEIPYHGRKD